MYNIKRLYFNQDRARNRIVARGLTLEQAQAHCKDPQTSSTTATTYTAKQRTKRYGPWFDSYEEAR